MTTDAPTIDEPTGETHEYDAHTEHKPDSYYVKVALLLAAVTAAEVSLSYLDVGWVFLPAMLILMAFKFFTVVGVFMHLRFDNRIFKWCFYSGLVLAILVYAAALATFQFFST